MKIRLILTLLFISFVANTAEAKLKVVSSFSILGNIIEEIGQDLIDHESIVGPNGDTHVYEPTPDDGILISTADLVIINGLSFETWFKRLVEASGDKKEVVVASEGIAFHKMIDPYFGGDVVPDPHVWGNVQHVIIWAKNIRDALVRNDPDNREKYEHNATVYIKKLEDLDRWIQDQFKNIPQSECKVITAHDAFNYFEKAYGVIFLAPQGLSTTDEPSATEMADLIRQIKKENITTIFVENISSAHLIKQLSSETGAVIGGTLYSDALSPKGEPGETYINMMKSNVRTIRSSLSCMRSKSISADKPKT